MTLVIIEGTSLLSFEQVTNHNLTLDFYLDPTYQILRNLCAAALVFCDCIFIRPLSSHLVLLTEM